MRERSATWSADGGGSSNQSSLYASSEATTKSRSAASVGEPLVERERRDRAGRVVRVVDPDERGVASRRSRRGRGGSRSPAAAAASARARRRRARRARTRDTPARRRRRCPSAPRSTSTCASEKIASFEPVGRHDLRVRDRRRRRSGARTSRPRPRAARAAPRASGYGERSGSASTSACRMIGSVGSFGSPLPKSITSTPCGDEPRGAPLRGGRTGSVAICRERRDLHRRRGMLAASRSARSRLAIGDLLVRRCAYARRARAEVDRVDALLGELGDRRPRLLRLRRRARARAAARRAGCRARAARTGSCSERRARRAGTSSRSRPRSSRVRRGVNR